MAAIAGCGLAAVLFFVLALGQKDAEPAGWTGMNGAAAASLRQLDAPQGEEEKAGSEAVKENKDAPSADTSGAAADGGAADASAGASGSEETAGEEAVPAGAPGPEGTGIAADANAGAGGAAAKSASAAVTADGKLNVNAATAEQLDGLKGIGPSKAVAIVADREANGPFRSVDDLLRVKGIGEKLLAGIKDGVVALP